MRLLPRPGTVATSAGRLALLLRPFGRTASAPSTPSVGLLRLVSYPGATRTRDGRSSLLLPPFGRRTAAPASGSGVARGLCVGGLGSVARLATGGLGWYPPPVPPVYADLIAAARARIKADPMTPSVQDVYFGAVPRLAAYPFVVSALINTTPQYTANRGQYLSDEIYQYDVLDTDEQRGERTRDRLAWLLSPGMPRMRIADGYIVAIWPKTLGGFKQPGMGRRGLTVYHSLFQVTYTVARSYRRVQT